MKSPLFKNHPFSLFLYLEWLLLSVYLLSEFRVGAFFTKPPFISDVDIQNPWLLFFTIIGFGALGLRLPADRILNKLVYTALELFLILLASAIAGKGIGFTPIPLLILVIRSCLIFQYRERLLIAVIVWLLFILSLNNTVEFNIQEKPVLLSKENAEIAILNLKSTARILFGFILVFVLLLVNALVAERQSRKELAIAHEQLKKYALRIEDRATLEERNRIAREIHDSLGHILVAQSIQLENALVFIESNVDRVKGFLWEAKKLGNNALKEVRTSVKTLRSDPLKGKSLEPALIGLLLEFQNRTQIEPEWDLQIARSLTADLNRAIYRIVQESLTNISKHSGANCVKVNIQTTNNYLCLRVEDNGIGFNPHQNTTGFGLQSMRDRCTALEGKLQINSEIGGGCAIIASFPLARLG
ncbi:MAG: sensor histidine kinase [Cyanosarcina radialis HA8281-LM2]|jgi:signal transduction histidine kinase|nr:sensor histidine kinase [Cyanosarcina radialis HA8281-LM2]